MILAVTIAEVKNPEAPFILQDQPYTASIKKAAEYGYEAVEIQLPDAEKFDKEEILACCGQMNIRIVSITTGLAVQDGLSLSANDEEIRKRTVERMYKMIDLAAVCGHDPAVMIGLLAGKVTDCPDKERFLHNLGSSLKLISDYAEYKNVGVNLEPVNHLDCPGLNTWDETVSLLDNYNCTYIRLGLDLYHMDIDERDMLDTIRRYKDRIGSVQLMDRNRHVPGDGDFTFAPIIETIKQTGYDGPIIMECLPLPDSDTALQKAAAFYHSYFG